MRNRPTIQDMRDDIATFNGSEGLSDDTVRSLWYQQRAALKKAGIAWDCNCGHPAIGHTCAKCGAERNAGELRV